MMSWNSAGEGHVSDYQLSRQDKLSLLMVEVHTVTEGCKVSPERVKRCSCSSQRKRVNGETVKRL